MGTAPCLQIVWKAGEGEKEREKERERERDHRHVALQLRRATCGGPVYTIELGVEGGREERGERREKTEREREREREREGGASQRTGFCFLVLLGGPAKLY